MIVIKSRALQRTVKIIVPFVIIPALAVFGSVAFDRKKHIIISLAAAVFSLLLFAAGFERRSTGTRRLVIVSVMTALCFAGRFIPLLKPVTAITVITAMYLGGEAGFLVGSLSAVLSNFYFGQGPWTPFQMLAWGLIGLIAGMLADPLKKSRIALIAYGIASGAVYSLIMDIWSVLWYADSFDIRLYLGSVATSLPFMASYIISDVLFLVLLAEPFGEKLRRIKTKYGV